MAPLRHQKMRVFAHFYHRPDPCRDVTTFPVSSQPPSPGPHDWFLLPPPLLDLADMWSRPFLRAPSSMPQYATPAIIAVSQHNHLSISTSTSDKSSIEDSKPRPTSNGVNVTSQQDPPQHPDCYLKFGWNGYDVVLQAYGRQAIVVAGPICCLGKEMRSLRSHFMGGVHKALCPFKVEGHAMCAMCNTNGILKIVQHKQGGEHVMPGIVRRVVSQGDFRPDRTLPIFFPPLHALLQCVQPSLLPPATTVASVAHVQWSLCSVHSPSRCHRATLTKPRLSE
ncbi:hypothetical protein HETIRDRAFT_432637 [Heterobasidion irregulare TC 32-1]|uniref:Uncharacterized protein n=1 Tax=Heterobasidion irregulare (strain TC 32-1) TaxID=747525 RepID=W4KJZ0_HETIT|nr:uncharacterized protein HETIRDRAFT_432637 [Heterobasidion irregulare TC 32-1]ETW86167.1 hypothetical protein HETIRDRAFT_432637 [Heterobasidion irregulare TC 32-1]